MNDTRAISPLTGQEVRAHNPYGSLRDGPGMFRFEHTQDGFADFRMSESVLMRIGHNREQYAYEEWKRDGNRILETRHHSVTDTLAALDLIRAYLWRSHHKPDSKTLVVTTADTHREFVEALEKADKLQYFVVKPMEEFIQEAKSLTLVTKALHTLENVYTFWQEQGLDKPLNLPYCVIDGNQNAVFRPNSNDPVENGMAYGCSKLTAPFAYEFLVEEGYVKQRKVSGSFGGFQVSAKGLAEIDKLSQASSVSTKEAFFIRRWAPELDQFFNTVREGVKARTGVDIKAVWDEKHNDRIDDRILSKIDHAAIVVIDISQRFNVGFEAGYAHKAGKTLILIRQKPPTDALPEEKLYPFDISTRSTFDWELDAPEALIEDLAERINVALKGQGALHLATA